MKIPIQIDQAFAASFCQTHHVRTLWLFGSVLTDQFNDASDVDVLVEFEPGQSPDYIELMRMQHRLSEHVGRAVDLRTPNELSRYFRDQVIATALVQYAA